MLRAGHTKGLNFFLREITVSLKLSGLVKAIPWVVLGEGVYRCFGLGRKTEEYGHHEMKN